MQCSRTVDSSILPGCSAHVLSVPRFHIWWLIALLPVDVVFQCQRRQDFHPQSVTERGCLQQSVPVLFRTAQDPELDIIQFRSEHLSSLSPQCDVALALQSNWERGGHLPARVQELCAFTHIMAALHAWLSAQCDGFLNRGSVVPPTSDIDVPEAASVATNPLNASTSLPSSARLVDNQVPPPSTVSLFSPAALPVPTQVPVPPVVSNPFVDFPTLSRLTRVHKVSLKVGQSG